MGITINEGSAITLAHGGTKTVLRFHSNHPSRPLIYFDNGSVDDVGILQSTQHMQNRGWAAIDGIPLTQISAVAIAPTAQLR